MKKKVVLVMGHGGHTVQMSILRETLLEKLELFYVTSKEHKFSADTLKNSLDPYETVYEFFGTRTKDSGKLHDLFGTLAMTIQAIILFIRDRPDVVISCGTSASVPLSYVGKLFRKKIIFIETRSRTEMLSGSGRLVYPIADVFFVQWKELVNKYPKTIYVGRFK